MRPEDLAEIVALAIKQAVAPLVARIAQLESHGERDRATAGAMLAVHEVNGLRERVAVLETRAPVAGPAGAPGRDGVDGLGFDDLAAEYDGDRTFSIVMRRGDQVKTCGSFVLPFLKWVEVYTPGHEYTRGDAVTWNGSVWHCQSATRTRPETVDGAPFWKLIVKRGEKGRDARELVAVR